MEYVYGNLDGFIDWFVSPETKDKAELKAGLRSVPPGWDWLVAHDRIKNELCRLTASLGPRPEVVRRDVQSQEPGWDLEEEWPAIHLVEMKQRLLAREQMRRSSTTSDPSLRSG